MHQAPFGISAVLDDISFFVLGCDVERVEGDWRLDVAV